MKIHWIARFVGRREGAIGIMESFSLKLKETEASKLEGEFWGRVYKEGYQDIIRLRFEPDFTTP